eukprot:12800483-Ditylum_brightwellii.AAC.2
MSADKLMNKPIMSSTTNLERLSKRTKPCVYMSEGDNVRKIGKEERRQSVPQTTNHIMSIIAQWWRLIMYLKMILRGRSFSFKMKWMSEPNSRVMTMMKSHNSQSKGSAKRNSNQGSSVGSAELMEKNDQGESQSSHAEI